MSANVCKTCNSADFRIFEGKSICVVCNAQLEGFVSRELENVAEVKSRKITSDTATETRYTSWEFYNHILLGLTKQLIYLGADKRLKGVVQRLWFIYLKKNEVVSDDPNELPKLPFKYRNMDSEIIYGRAKRKRDFKKYKSEFTQGMDDDLVMAKRKKFQKLAVSEAFNESQRDEADWSTMNQSIADIRTETEKVPMQVNHFAYCALLRQMSEEHLKEHLDDLENELTCHYFSNKEVMLRAYKNFREANISKNVLYYLLYAGLLIIKSEIQAGDLLRFIVDGQVSYNWITHLLSEDLAASKKNYSWHKGSAPVKSEFLKKTWEIIDFIGVRKYIPMQNLPSLCKRYCKELNLPDEIQHFALNLMSESQPEFGAQSGAKDFEARTMCFIVFTLKMLFAFDSVTEYKFSKLASLLSDKYKMFDIMKWMEFIRYRRRILRLFHFPTQAVNPGDGTGEGLIHYLESQSFIKDGKNEPWEKTKMLGIIEALKAKAHLRNNPLKFEPSLRPMQDYLDQIIDSSKLDEGYLLQVLQHDFTWYSLDFLANTAKYAKVKVLLRNANEDMEFAPVVAKRAPDVATVKCQLVDGSTPDDQDFDFLEKKTSVGCLKRATSAYGNLGYKVLEQGETFATYDTHYEPEKRFWLRLAHRMVEHSSIAEEYIKDIPYNFKVVLEECAAILQSSLDNFCQDYVYFEAYMCFGFNGKGTKILSNAGDDKALINCVNRYAKEHW